MSINQAKFSKFNEERKTSIRNISGKISELDALFSVALKQQAYMRENPDDNGVDGLIEIVTPDVTAILTSFNELALKVADFTAVSTGTMTIDELLAKYPAINLTEYSAELL